MNHVRRYLKTGQRSVGVLLVFATLATLHTWPLASAPGTLSRNDNADAQLNAWIIAWIQHTLPREPMRLFDANIFHPEPRTLAFSEPLLLPAVLGLPLRLLGDSPILIHNLLLLLGMVLTGATMFALIREQTGDTCAALLGGSVLAFNAHTMTRLPHIQAHWAVGLPLAYMALDRLLHVGLRSPPSLRLGKQLQTEAGSTHRNMLLLTIGVVALGLTSGYLVIITVVGLMTALLVRLPEWRHRASVVLTQVGAATAIAIVAMMPVALPYWRASQEQNLTRSLDEIASFAISPLSYLATASRIHHGTWAAQFYELAAGNLFPGIIPLGLACVAVFRWARGRGRVSALVAIGAMGFVMSLGPATPLYKLFWTLFPPARALRDPSRFGLLVIFAVALLAVFGLAELRRQLPRRWGLAVGLLAVAAVNLEMLHAPIPYQEFKGFPPLYRQIAEGTDTVVAELPFPGPQAVVRNAKFVLASTQHWRPLVNGYSGFTPASYVEHARRLRAFPGPRAMAELRRLRVTHLVIHEESFDEETNRTIARRLRTVGEFEPVTATLGGPRLYRRTTDLPGSNHEVR